MGCGISMERDLDFQLQKAVLVSPGQVVQEITPTGLQLVLSHTHGAPGVTSWLSVRASSIQLSFE